MTDVLIIDCGVEWGGAKGELNHSLCAVAVEELKRLGLRSMITRVDACWNAYDEQGKFVYSRYFIVQTPIFWMAPPWQFKRYQDVVFNTRAFIYGDGRESDAPDDGYGTSGLLVDRSYMLSITCNAPLAAFDRPHDFFEGRGADGLLMPVHKSLQFIGMKQLPTFMAYDVVKNLHYDELCASYRAQLQQVFSKLKP